MKTPRKHRHSLLIQQWLDDASLCVQSRHPHCAAWQDVDKPEWFEGQEYRFKPRTIRIGDMEEPEPMRVAPNVGDVYWVVQPAGNASCFHQSWAGNFVEMDWLRKGLMHSSSEAAAQHAKALIALTEVKQ